MIIQTNLRQFFFILITFLLPLTLYSQPLLVLDSGHSPKDGGVISAKGQYEVIYNDHFVDILKTELEKSGWNIILTRSPKQEMSLSERVKIANKANAKIFLSIHHDSTQLKYLKSETVNGQQVWTTTQPIQGFSLFVSGINPQFTQSQKIAQAIGQSIRKYTQRSPAMHHAEAIEGENRLLLDKQNGVYRYDNLAVLRLTQIPAVLLEVGVIVDKKDEHYVSQIKNQQKIIKAIVKSLKYFQ